MEPNSTYRTHGHHQVAAALFVGALILGGSMILSAELMKPARYEFHSQSEPNSYTIFDTDSGRAISAKVGDKVSAESLGS
jgi:hypothetical protein